MQQPFSVLIIVKGRETHLRNVLAGIELSQLKPVEIIIVRMNEPVKGLRTDVPAREITLVSERPLPLAKARNTAAMAATTENLIFLDVDCIPDKFCFGTLLHDLSNAALVMADPHYLQKPVEDIDYDELAADARLNPARSSIEFGAGAAYEMFWSLGFAIRKSDFELIGGFDETFTGYGGEDTDFAFSARLNNLPFVMSRAVVYHQNHKSYDPPLNWIEDIVANALAFKHKWSVWPMEGWLRKFSGMGLVEWDAGYLRLVRKPTESEIKNALKQNAI